MLEFHPLANLFPLIEGKAFDDLVADVKANGVRERIVILDGKILDGRNRYRAGIAAGLIDVDAPAHNGIGMNSWCSLYLPEYEGDPLTWVLSKNLHRRHLDESQRAAVAARLETLSHGGDRRSASDPEGGEAAPVQDAKLQIDRKTAAGMLNVSPRSVASAKKVINEGAPELIAKVDQGELAVSVAEKLLTLPKAKQTELVNAMPARALKNAAKKVSRDDKEKRLGEKQKALPNKLYGVIYADPEWRFETWSPEGLDRAADNHYPTSDLADIKARPVGMLAARDSVLFLWVTAPHHAAGNGAAVMRYWGFTPKAEFIWHKADAGTGYWNRNCHEVLLVGTKGNIPAPAPGTQFLSVMASRAGAHSEKPDWAYELIEAHFPNLSKIELNARRARHGWDRWGNEAPEDDAPGHTDLMVSPEAIDEALAGNPPSEPLSTADADEAIRAAYERGDAVADIAVAIGRPGNKNYVKNRARVMGISSRDRQREAASAFATAQHASRRGGGAVNADRAPDQGSDRDV